MKNTLLLVFIHGFKGSDNTFANFPKDLRVLISHALPNIEVLSIQYPQFETRGDLRECVARFKEWLQNKVIDLEVANGTPSPTIDPSVHVILCGHSMGGIVAAETVLSIAQDLPVPPDSTTAASNNTSTNGSKRASKSATNLAPDANEKQKRSTSAPPPSTSSFLFPHVQAVLAFDTPYLGISPGVLAHGAENHLNTASSAYKAFNGASKVFGWASPRSSSPAPDLGTASAKGLPAPNSGGGWDKWGTYAMYGGAAAAVAAAGGAAYLSRNQIAQGFSWAGSHLEFVGCLARGEELQKRVEAIVSLTKTHDIGFADFYCSLGKAVSGKTQYAGSLVGEQRTFCVVPKEIRKDEKPTGSKRASPETNRQPPKRRKTEMEGEMDHGDEVDEYANDTKKDKGRWVKCVNDIATDELKGHTSMFAPARNPDYYAMSNRARDQIAEWVDKRWYEASSVEQQDSSNVESESDATAGAGEA